MTLQGRLNRIRAAIHRAQQRRFAIARLKKQLDAEESRIVKRMYRHEARAQALMQADAQMWVELYMRKPAAAYEDDDLEYR